MQSTNTEITTRKIFDLEERTTEFGKRIIRACRNLSRDPINDVLINQIIRSAGSVGANYREANDALGKKDFIHRLKISRKEAKETLHWLELIREANPHLEIGFIDLFQEATELKNILSAIIQKSV